MFIMRKLLIITLFLIPSQFFAKHWCGYDIYCNDDEYCGHFKGFEASIPRCFPKIDSGQSCEYNNQCKSNSCTDIKCYNFGNNSRCAGKCK